MVLEDESNRGRDKKLNTHTNGIKDILLFINYGNRPQDQICMYRLLKKINKKKTIQSENRIFEKFRRINCILFFHIS